jgi:hypothetical protein
MPSISRIGPKLAIFGVVAGLVLVGSAARYSAAQNPAQVVPPPTNQVPGTTVNGEEPKASAPEAKPETRSELASPLPAPGPADHLAVPHLNAEPDAGPFSGPIGATKAPAPVTVAPGDATAEVDDPEKVATAFLEQNQKLAEAHLKTLKEEAQKLKARLLKVEAGIKRWDRLLGALKQSQSAVTARPPAAIDESSPTDDDLIATPRVRGAALPATEALDLKPVDPPRPDRSLSEATKAAGKAEDAAPPRLR